MRDEAAILWELGPTEVDGDKEEVSVCNSGEDARTIGVVLAVISEGEMPVLVLGDIGALVLKLWKEELTVVIVELVILTGDVGILTLDDVEALDVLKSCAELGETEELGKAELIVMEVDCTLDADKLGCKELVAAVGFNKGESEKLAAEVDCTVGLGIDRSCKEVEVELVCTVLEVVVSADSIVTNDTVEIDCTWLTSTDVGSLLEGIG